MTAVITLHCYAQGWGLGSSAAQPGWDSCILCRAMGWETQGLCLVLGKQVSCPRAEERLALRVQHCQQERKCMGASLGHKGLSEWGHGWEQAEACTFLLAPGETSSQGLWPFYSKFPFVPVGQRARCARGAWGQSPWHFGVVEGRALRRW